MANSIAKTRDKLVEVARQLFAKIGVENTTMNDIAVASKKGRRTLYTYFKSKQEIYQAVIQSELNILYQSLENVVNADLPADRKLLDFIRIRLESIKNVVFRNGTLRANFFRDIWRVESVRKKFDIREITCIKAILDEGVDSGVFEINDTETTSEILHYAFKGLEAPYIRGKMSDLNEMDVAKAESIKSFIFNGIKKKQ